MFDLSSDDITTAPVHRVLALLSIPLLAQNIVEVASLVIDLFWIGRIGGNSLAAVGLAAPLFSLLLILVIGVPYIGTMILVSQRLGADNKTGARSAAFNGVVLGAIFGLGVGGGAAIAAPTLVRLIASVRPGPAPTAVVELTIRYFRILSIGLVFAATSDALEAAFVARGDSQAALYISVATVLTVLIADPLLIFGFEAIPALGVAGAALASVLGFLAGLIVAVGLVFTGRSGGVLSRTSTRVRIDEFTALFNQGLAPAAQQANRRVAESILIVIVFAAGGATALAAYAVGTRVFSMASIPAQGLQSATQTVVGQNLGAGNVRRATRTISVGIMMLGGVLTVVGVAQWSMATALTSILAPELHPKAVALATRFLQLLAISYPAFGMMYVLQGSYNGASRGGVSFRSSLLQYWGLQLPIGAGALLLGGDAVAIFGAIAGSHVITALVLGIYSVVHQNDIFRAAADEVADAGVD